MRAGGWKGGRTDRETDITRLVVPFTMLQTRMEVNNAGSERCTLGVRSVMQNKILMLANRGKVYVARMGDNVTF
jgi:hypothetical protein